MIMILLPSIPPVYRGFLSIPNVAFENSMACHVFRAVHFGIIRPTTSFPNFPTFVEPRMPCGVRYEDDSRRAVRSQLYNNSRPIPLTITVTTECLRKDMNKKLPDIPDQDWWYWGLRKAVCWW
jgi:hypothetical protein